MTNPRSPRNVEDFRSGLFEDFRLGDYSMCGGTRRRFVLFARLAASVPHDCIYKFNHDLDVTSIFCGASATG